MRSKWLGCAMIGATLAGCVGIHSADWPSDSSPLFAQQRAAIAARIRDRVREVAPEADDAHFERVLRAVEQIPREAFVDAAERSHAYDDRPLPIGHDQTISEAYIQAVMTAAVALPPRANVLDVGTGSGYQAALLGELTDRVASIEIVKPLADRARDRLRRLGYRDVTVRAGDGFAGWPDRAPFDAIIVAAGAATVPQPLIDQLKIGGRLVMPIGPTWASEQLVVLTKTGPSSDVRCTLGWTMFVALIGQGERPPGAAGLFDTHMPPCHGAPLSAPAFVPVTKDVTREAGRS